jgi:dihydrofolate reductase
MRELIADLFISLDGCAAGTNEAAYFGYDGPDLSRWVQTELDRPQEILMGRNTYNMLSNFAATATDPANVRMRELPKVVFSNTLGGELAWSNTRVIGGDLAQQIGAFKQQPGDPIRSFGSIQLVQGLLDVGLVDRLRLMVFPVLLGTTGSEPFSADLRRIALQLVGTTVLDSRLVLLEYKPNSVHQ